MPYRNVFTVEEWKQRLSSIRVYISHITASLSKAAAYERRADKTDAWPVDDQVNDFMGDNLRDATDEVVTLITSGADFETEYAYLVKSGRPSSNVYCEAVIAGLADHFDPSGFLRLTFYNEIYGVSVPSPIADVVGGGAGAGDVIEVSWIDHDDRSQSTSIVERQTVDTVIGSQLTFLTSPLFGNYTVNGDFGAAAGWVFGGGAAWNAGGWADMPAGGSALQTTATMVAGDPLHGLIPGRWYLIEFTLAGVGVAEQCTVTSPGVTLYTTAAGVSGTFVVPFLATEDSTYILFTHVGAGLGFTLDSVSLHMECPGRDVLGTFTDYVHTSTNLGGYSTAIELLCRQKWY